MNAKIDLRKLAVVLAVAVLVAAWPLYRWFTAPALETPTVIPSKPMKGALFLPVALAFTANPAPGAAPAKIDGLRVLAPRPGPYVPYTEKQRKALKKQVDDYLRSLNLPMDAPSLTRPAQPNAMVLAAEATPTVEPDGTVTVSVRFTVTQKVHVRKDGSEPWEAVTWVENAAARVARADTDRAVVALTRQCLDRVVRRYREDNAG